MDEATFLRLVEETAGRLYRVARTMLRCDHDCMDAYQEALLKAWRSRDSLRDVSRFSAWLTRILIHECRNIQRRQWRIFPVAQPDMGFAEDEGYDPGVRDAVQALPENLRLAVVLHYVEGYSVRDAADMLGIAPNALRTRLYRARARLRLELDNAQEEMGT